MSEIKVAPNADVKNSDPNKAAIGLENDAKQRKFKMPDIQITGNNGQKITVPADLGIKPAPVVNIPDPVFLNMKPVISESGQLNGKNLSDNLVEATRQTTVLKPDFTKQAPEKPAPIVEPKDIHKTILDNSLNISKKIDFFTDDYKKTPIPKALENEKTEINQGLETLDKSRVSTSKQSKGLKVSLEELNDRLDVADKVINRDISKRQKDSEKAEKQIKKLSKKEGQESAISELQDSILKNTSEISVLKLKQKDFDALRKNSEFLSLEIDETTKLLKAEEKEAAKKQRKEKLDAFDKRMESISDKVDKWILNAGDFLEHNFVNVIIDIYHTPGAERVIGDELYRHSKDKSKDLNNAKVKLKEKVSYIDTLNKEIEKSSEEARKNNEEYFQDRDYFIEPGKDLDHKLEVEKEKILSGNDSEKEKTEKLTELQKVQEENKKKLRERNKYINEAWNGGFEWVLTVEERFDLFSKDLLEETPKTDETFKDVGGYYVFPDAILESNLGGIEPVKNEKSDTKKSIKEHFSGHSSEIQEALNKALAVGSNPKNSDVLDKDNIFKVPFRASQTKQNDDQLKSSEEIPNAETLIKQSKKQKEINEERSEVEISTEDLTSHPEEKKINYKVVKESDTPQMILGGMKPDEKKNVNIPIYELVSAGPDAQSNMFDVYFITYKSGTSQSLTDNLFTLGEWEIDKNNWLNLPEILSARIEDIKVPFFSRGSYETKFCGTSVQKPSGEVSGDNKSSFKVRLDTSLFYLSLFNQMARLDPHGFKKKDAAEEENKLIKERRYAFDDTVKPEMFNNARFCELPNIYSNNLHYFDITDNPKLNIAIRRSCYDYFGTKYRKQAMDKALDYGSTYWEEGTPERPEFPEFSGYNQTGYKDDWFIFEDCKLLGPNDALNFSRDSASTASMTYDFVFRRLQRASLYNPGRTVHPTK